MLKYFDKTHQQNIISMNNAEYSSVLLQSKEFYLKLHKKAMWEEYAT